MKMKTLVRLLLIIILLYPHQARSEEMSNFLKGQFSWNISKPILSPAERPDDPCFSVKDPTVVYYQGKWHVFHTTRSKINTHQIEYVSAESWEKLNSSPRYILNCRDGYFCAPQVFYFSPHKSWYLVYQVVEENREPGLQPAFSTTENISNPNSWTKAQLLFKEGPEGINRWIDFWIICDDQKAYLFFTSLDGHLWRMSTNIDDFPEGFSNFQLALKADIFEAAHIYRLEGINKYMAVIEAIRNRTPKGRRYYVTYLANTLESNWRKLASSEDKPFASYENVDQPGERWTDYISHGELIRSGYDEKMLVNPDNLQFLFQGVTDGEAAGKKYGEIPWRLGILTRK
ncbi:glycoside hydrolase [Candidatus Poribacteria bacterium]|nr:glycoside hydrolase [Candidatus Poribacteria bacterium]